MVDWPELQQAKKRFAKERQEETTRRARQLAEEQAEEQEASQRQQLRLETKNQAQRWDPTVKRLLLEIARATAEEGRMDETGVTEEISDAVCTWKVGGGGHRFIGGNWSRPGYRVTLSKLDGKWSFEVFCRDPKDPDHQLEELPSRATTEEGLKHLLMEAYLLGPGVGWIADSSSEWDL